MLLYVVYLSMKPHSYDLLVYYITWLKNMLCVYFRNGIDSFLTDELRLFGKRVRSWMWLIEAIPSVLLILFSIYFNLLDFYYLNGKSGLRFYYSFPKYLLCTLFLTIESGSTITTRGDNWLRGSRLEYL